MFSRHRLHALTTRAAARVRARDGLPGAAARARQELAWRSPALQLLRELGGRFHLLDAAQCRTLEPALNPDTALHAGIHLPDDEVGNCRQFAHLLRTEAQTLGARLCFHTVVQRIVPGKTPQVVHRYMPPAESTQLTVAPARSDGVDPQTEPPAEPMSEDFDAVVVCAAHGRARAAAAAWA